MPLRGSGLWGGARPRAVLRLTSMNQVGEDPESKHDSRRDGHSHGSRRTENPRGRVVARDGQERDRRDQAEGHLNPGRSPLVEGERAESRRDRELCTELGP